MYLKDMYLKKEAIEQSIKDNSPVSKDLVIQIKQMYDITSYNAATEYLFGNCHMVITNLTIFQAKMLIAYVEAFKVAIIPKTKKKKSINTNLYRNIWNTSEK